MHRTTLFAVFAVLATGASLAACGSDTTTSTSTTGAGGGSTSATSSTGDTTSSTTSTTSTTAGATSSASGTGGGGPTLINGCDPAALEDHTKDATVEIKFGGALNQTYAPPCIKVKSGTMVTFTGGFAVHPLAAGATKPGVVPVPDATSPIKSTSSAVPSVTFAISPAGSYPYYCTEHYSIGMEGLIVAE